MTWPTATTTASVDSAYDAPQSARADIKQNIDNVNSIVSEFGTVDISTPEDGQLLAYDGTEWSVSDTTVLNGAYIPVTNPGGNTPYPTSFTASPSATITETFDFTVDGSFDDQNIFNLSEADDNPEIPLGTYSIQISGYWSMQISQSSGSFISSASVKIELLNTDTSTVLATFTPSQTHDISTDNNNIHRLMWCDLTTTETFASATNIQVKATATITSGGSSTTGSSFIGGGFMARFIKTA